MTFGDVPVKVTVPKLTLSAKNWTVPVGACPPGTTGRTVAVKVTASPETVVDLAEVTVVMVPGGIDDLGQRGRHVAGEVAVTRVDRRHLVGASGQGADREAGRGSAVKGLGLEERSVDEEGQVAGRGARSQPRGRRWP